MLGSAVQKAIRTGRATSIKRDARPRDRGRSTAPGYQNRRAQREKRLAELIELEREAVFQQLRKNKPKNDGKTRRPIQEYGL